MKDFNICIASENLPAVSARVDLIKPIAIIAPILANTRILVKEPLPHTMNDADFCPRHDLSNPGAPPESSRPRILLETPRLPGFSAAFQKVASGVFLANRIHSGNRWRSRGSWLLRTTHCVGQTTTTAKHSCATLPPGKYDRPRLDLHLELLFQ